MALTRSFIRNAAMTPLDARLMNMAMITCNADGTPRPGVLSQSAANIVTALATMAVAVTAAEFVTTKGKADGVAVFTNDGTVNVAIPAAPASNSRIDVVWVKHEDSTTGDGASLPIFGVTAGVAAAAPAKSAIPTGALELATLRVYSGTTAANGGANILTNTFQMTSMRDGAVSFRTRAEMDAVTTLPVGQLATVATDANAALRGLWIFDGTRWAPGPGVQLQESFTWVRANVDDMHQYPQLVDDGANTTDPTIATFQRVSGTDPDGVGGVKIAVPGIYHVAVSVVLAAGATGLTFVQVGADSDIFWMRSNAMNGEGRMSAGQIIRTTVVDQVVPIVFYKKNGSLGANSGRVMVRRIG